MENRGRVAGGGAEGDGTQSAFGPLRALLLSLWPPAFPAPAAAKL